MRIQHTALLQSEEHSMQLLLLPHAALSMDYSANFPGTAQNALYPAPYLAPLYDTAAVHAERAA